MAVKPEEVKARISIEWVLFRMSRDSGDNRNHIRICDDSPHSWDSACHDYVRLFKGDDGPRRPTSRGLCKACIQEIEDYEGRKVRRHNG